MRARVEAGGSAVRLLRHHAMRALIGGLAVLSSGCYLAGYGSAPLDSDAASAEMLDATQSEPPLDAGPDAAARAPMDASQPDANQPVSSDASASDAAAPLDAASDASSAADSGLRDSEADAAEDDAAIADAGMDAF